MAMQVPDPLGAAQMGTLPSLPPRESDSRSEKAEKAVSWEWDTAGRGRKDLGWEGAPPRTNTAHGVGSLVLFPLLSAHHSGW